VRIVKYVVFCGRCWWSVGAAPMVTVSDRPIEYAGLRAYALSTVRNDGREAKAPDLWTEQLRAGWGADKLKLKRASSLAYPEYPTEPISRIKRSSSLRGFRNMKPYGASDECAAATRYREGRWVRGKKMWWRVEGHTGRVSLQALCAFAVRSRTRNGVDCAGGDAMRGFDVRGWGGGYKF